MLKFTYNSKGEVIAKGSVLAGQDSYTKQLFESLEKSLQSNPSLRAEALDMYKALDTQSAVDGGNLVDTILYRGIMERVRLFGNVAPEFRDLQMPSAIYELPIELADATVYITPENTTVANQTAYSSTNPTFGKSTLTARKFTGRSHVSGEIVEDSVIDIISYVVDNHAKAIAQGLDTAILDGDSAGTQDSDIIAGRDVKVAFDGLRKLALASAGLIVAGGGTSATLASVLTAKGVLGKYAVGAEASNLRLICSPRTYAQYEALAYAASNANQSAFAFRDGVLVSIAGVPIIVSELVRNDLTANGVFTGTGALSYALLVNVSRFVTGTRSQISFESDRRALNDQTELFSRIRKGFTGIGAPASGTNPTVAIIRNISA